MNAQTASEIDRLLIISDDALNLALRLRNGLDTITDDNKTDFSGDSIAAVLDEWQICPGFQMQLGSYTIIPGIYKSGVVLMAVANDVSKSLNIFVPVARRAELELSLRRSITIVDALEVKRGGSDAQL